MYEQNYDNNQKLAELYQKYVKQLITIFPIIWKHEINGNWFVSHIFDDGKSGWAPLNHGP